MKQNHNILVMTRASDNKYNNKGKTLIESVINKSSLLYSYKNRINCININILYQKSIQIIQIIYKTIQDTLR